MIPNKSNRILAGILALAFLMPLLIKSEHLLFSDHNHDFHCCTHEGNHLESSENHCSILDFDYFFFTAGKLLKLSAKLEFSITAIAETIQDLFASALRLSYALRAPPTC